MRSGLAMKFSKPRGEQNGVINYQHNVLLRTARKIMEGVWKDDFRYCMTAIYFPEAKAMVVDLTSATELKALRPRKK